MPSFLCKLVAFISLLFLASLYRKKHFLYIHVFDINLCDYRKGFIIIFITSQEKDHHHPWDRQPGWNELVGDEYMGLLVGFVLLGLNSLQSGLHRQHMKDLFVELCLTVPVRLSSLLPYLPLLMDPLVSALNGSQTLVSQVHNSVSCVWDSFIQVWQKKI